MSTNLGPNLPQNLLDLFSGDQLERKLGFACVLVTQGGDGFPHPCIVTPGELVARDATTMRVALYATSTASRNLSNGSAATLCLDDGGAAYYVKLTSESVANPPAALEGLAVFTLTPKHVLRDIEEGAEVTSGFRFTDFRGDQAVLDQWGRVVAGIKASF
jgi:hypothetical protein